MQLLEQSGDGAALEARWRYRPTEQDLGELYAWFRKRKPFPIKITGEMSGWIGDPETSARERSGVEAWKRKREIGRVN